CEPAVVRSDLLGEQNVPVFCRLSSIKINPLIKVSSIRSISFKGDYPEGVAGISFHPARAAIRTYDTLLGSPLLNDIGYVVIILKRNKKEDEMPEWVGGNLTATIYYDADEAFGTGKGEYYLQTVTEGDWDKGFEASSFWYGRGFLRAVDITEDGRARIGLYTGKNNLFRNVNLKEGETSGLIYFPGFYCRAGLQVKLNKIVGPEKQARLEIDGEELWVRKGSKILNGRCTVSKINALGEGLGNVEISCPGQKIILMVQQSKAAIKIGDDENSYDLGKSVVSGRINEYK
ncbi:unnamed protein product, partial [marine sediment metagenome]